MGALNDCRLPDPPAAAAGLLLDRVKEGEFSHWQTTLEALWGLPVLGALFRSVEYRRKISELAILVTPEIIAPLNPRQVPPAPGEDVVEPNDFELYGLGLLACGLNTCRLAAKFERLFRDVDVILIPDRDRAGEEGAEHSARVLRNVALSTQIAVLPAEFKESNGDDVRDVLRRPDGRELVLQAIADAKPSEAGGESGEGEDSDVSAEIQMPEGDPLTLTVSPTFGKPQRRVVAKREELSHRDRINTDSDISRGRFIKKLAAKLEVEVDVLGPLVDPQLTALAADDLRIGDKHSFQKGFIIVLHRLKEVYAEISF